MYAVKITTLYTGIVQTWKRVADCRNSIAHAAVSSNQNQQNSQKEYETVCAVVDAQSTDPVLQQVRKETETDKTLQSIMQYVANGWPECKGQVSVEATPFYSFREEIVCENGLLFKKDRCIIPSSMRKAILNQLHSGHMGLQSTLRRARETVFLATHFIQHKELD